MKYKILAAVEIGGTLYYPATGRRPADVVDESEFRVGNPLRHPSVYRDHPELGDEPELGEVDSLIATGHIEAVVD